MKHRKRTSIREKAMCAGLIIGMLGIAVIDGNIRLGASMIAVGGLVALLANVRLPIVHIVIERR